MSSSKQITFDSIEDAISEIKEGKIIIVVDDENRENEGDFIAAAECATPEIINFMAQHGRGLICTPLAESYCNRLDLYPMVQNNTDPMGTAFTVSVDLNGNGVTSGISAADRAKTVRALVDEKSKSTDFIRPGHVFPLTAKEGGVLRRTGHTEAAIDFARLAGFKPAGVIVEIMNEDGTMARLPELRRVADKYNLKLVSIEDLVAYRMKHDSLIEQVEDFPLETRFGTFRLRAFQQNTNKQIHMALTLGDWKDGDQVLTRIQSMKMPQDLLKNLMTGHNAALEKVIEKIKTHGSGAILFINPPNDATQLVRQLGDLKSKGKSLDSTSSYMDEKDFGIGAQMLHQLKIHKLSLLTNSERTKRVGIGGYGIEILDWVNY
jgi:3,4-dihydroxy 2-butanone 4-phosphate synthase/GTP cyclohydrolase II